MPAQSAWERAAVIKLADTRESIERCYDVMRELRPSLAGPAEFLALVLRQQSEGYMLAFLESEGQVVTVAGFRVQHLLASGLTMYVDDLVTAAAHRSKGNGKRMLDWLVARAREQGCETFSLDSGTHRKDAHAFYFREGMRISSFHFMLPISV